MTIRTADNAAMKSFFALLQKNVLDRRPWATRDGLRIAIFEYIEIFHNRRRRHSALGYRTPIEYELLSENHAVAAVS